MNVFSRRESGPGAPLMNFFKSRARHGIERGATLVETVLVMPVLLLMLFGALEFGFLFMNTTSIANGIATAGRAGAATTTQVIPDSKILDQLKSRPLALRDAQYVVIYRATAANGSAMPACLAGASVRMECNVYKVQDGVIQSGDESAWPSSSRVPGEDYLGVAVVGKHVWLSTFDIAEIKVSDSGAVLLEPYVEDVGPSSDAVAFGEGDAWGTGTPGNPGSGGAPQDSPSAYTGWWNGILEPTNGAGGTIGGGGGGSNT